MIKKLSNFIFIFFLMSSFSITSVWGMKQIKSIREMMDTNNNALDGPYFDLVSNMKLTKKKLLSEIPSGFKVQNHSDYIEIYEDEDNLAEHRAFYFFKKNSVSGYFLMEPISMGSANNSESLKTYVFNLVKDDNYIQSVLSIPSQVKIDFYKKEHEDFIERYAIINDNQVVFEAFYPIAYENVLKPKVVNYINEYMEFYLL